MPLELDRAELKMALDITAVLEPLRLATKLLESKDRAVASLYLPVWSKTAETLLGKPGDVLQYPKELRDKRGKGVQIKSLSPAADQLRQFLANDLDKIRKRHFENTTGELLLICASFLDPRFRTHSMWKMLDLKEVEEKVVQMVAEHWETWPILQKALADAAQNPMNHTLESLLPPKRGRGRGRGRGRAKATPKSKAEEMLKQSADALPAASSPKAVQDNSGSDKVGFVRAYSH